MRIRETDFLPPEYVADTSTGMQSVTYEVRTITPIFGGGVEAGEPDKEMPIRASAIRGQLRYWWRFLASHRKGETITDHNQLFEQEREIWGGMGEKNKDYASKIKIKVSNITSRTIKPCYEYRPNGINDKGKPKYLEQFLHDIPPYALFLGKGKKPCDRSNPLQPGEKESDVILANLKFKLDISSMDLAKIKEQHWKSVLQAVRWWANFGGLGARTRRGAGSIAIDNIEILKARDVEAFGCKLAIMGETTQASKAWNKSIGKLQSFRQGEGLGRGSASDPDAPKKLGRSYWPEADSIRLITDKNAKGKHIPINKSGTFPRAAFGLPIIFDFNVKPEVGEPPKTELTPAGENRERMASPLIIKAQYIGNGQFLPIALLLPTDNMNDLQEVTLKCIEGSCKNLPKTLSRKGSDVWWPVNEAVQKKVAGNIEPLKKRGNNVLDAFMSYFVEDS